ncbi:DUF4225 domain-containing protein [Lonsdalea quercina]|uniref:DUF4225 domain-containing protein n=1 Tax=Lonsdalea quercina TaxID=71657 RepID=UPI003975B223
MSQASLAGDEDDTGDLLYSAIDLTLSIYASFRTPTLVDDSSRLISRGCMEQPGTTKLFRGIHKDFSPKYNTANKLMKVCIIVISAKKAYAKFKDQNYFLGNK